MDLSPCKELAECVELLTTTGRSDLDESLMKKLKSICKQSDDYVKQTFNLVMYQLEEEHAEIRLSAFQIMDEIFRRSHVFRELVVSDLQTVFELTVETDPDEPLPPPKTIADKLKLKALQCIQDWDNKYGEGYKKLHIGYNYLKECKKVDFNDMEVRTIAQRTREQQARQRQENILTEKLQKIIKEMQAKQVDIEECLTQLDNAMKLLMESVEDLFQQDDFIPTTSRRDSSIVAKQKTPSNEQYLEMPMNINETNEDNDFQKVEDLEVEKQEDADALMEQHGLGSHKYSLTLELKLGKKRVPVNVDNSAIVETLKELVLLIRNSHLPVANKWIQGLTKVGQASDHLKKAIDIKRALQMAISKYEELNIEHFISKEDGKDSDSETDDDFEEVPSKDGFEEDVKPPLDSCTPKSKSTRPCITTLQSRVKVLKQEEEDPTTAASTIKALAKKASNTSCVDALEKLSQSSYSTVADDNLAQPGTSKIDSQRRDKLIPNAPKVRFDNDLFDWGQKLQMPSVIRFDSLHRFWQPIENETEEVAKPDLVAGLRMRKIEFSGKFEPVNWQCLAPLKNGKLCPRYDRQKCPFHGAIIARDKMGNPTNPADIERLKREQELQQKNKVPDWQDPELLRELKASTGLDLTVGKKRGKANKKGSKRKKYGNLTDVEANQNTSRKRLESKVFNRSAVKRVSSTMDALDYTRHRDKFGDQFNYVHMT